MIDWIAFVTVVVVSLVAACIVVALFSLALRLGDGEAPWRRAASIGLFVVCALFVLFGIYLIVPALHAVA
jgi:hypothetical protein